MVSIVTFHTNCVCLHTKQKENEFSRGLKSVSSPHIRPQLPFASTSDEDSITERQVGIEAQNTYQNRQNS